MDKLDLPSVYLTNLGMYAEGSLVGKWINVPISIEDFNKELKNIGVDGERYEEFFFTDWENIEGIGEYSSIEEINSIAKVTYKINEIKKHFVDNTLSDEQFVQETLTDYFKERVNNDDQNPEDVIEDMNSIMIFTEDFDNHLSALENYGYYLLESCDLLDYSNLDDEVKKYIDVEKVARNYLFNEPVIGVKTIGKYNIITVIIII